jgi:hypothetical protein
LKQKIETRNESLLKYRKQKLLTILQNDLDNILFNACYNVCTMAANESPRPIRALLDKVGPDSDIGTCIQSTLMGGGYRMMPLVYRQFSASITDRLHVAECNGDNIFNGFLAAHAGKNGSIGLEFASTDTGKAPFMGRALDALRHQVPKTRIPPPASDRSIAQEFYWEGIDHLGAVVEVSVPRKSTRLFGLMVPTALAHRPKCFPIFSNFRVEGRQQQQLLNPTDASAAWVAMLMDSVIRIAQSRQPKS